MERDHLEAHADVFQCLADETRLEILEAIFECFLENGPVTYSRAMEAAGFDDSGHFSYHLNEMKGELVFEEDGRYRPTTAAHEIIPVVLAGRLVDYDFDPEARTVGACLQCGHPLIAVFEYRFLVTCVGCDNWVLYFPLAPAVAAENDLRTLASELDRTVRNRQAVMQANRCEACGGATSVHILSPGSRPYSRAELDVSFNVGCENCHRGQFTMSAGQYLLGHPTVREYCRDHDIDLVARPQWEHSWTQTDIGTEIRARDPWELEVYASVDGCRLVAVIENDGSISHVDHVRVAGGDDD